MWRWDGNMEHSTNTAASLSWQIVKAMRKPSMSDFDLGSLALT